MNINTLQFLLIIALFSCSSKPNDNKKASFFSKFSSCDVYEYLYEYGKSQDSGRFVEQRVFDKLGNIIEIASDREKTTYKYNEKGNLLEKTTYFTMDYGNYPKGTVEKKTIYTYNSQGRKISREDYEVPNVLLAQINFVYKDTLLIKEYGFGNSENEEYCTVNRVIDGIKLADTTNFELRYFYNNGLINKKEIFTKNKLREKYTYTYTNNKLAIKEIEIIHNDDIYDLMRAQVKDSINYEYNSKNNIVGVKAFNTKQVFDSTLKKITKLPYTESSVYDEKNNLISSDENYLEIIYKGGSFHQKKSFEYNSDNILVKEIEYGNMQEPRSEKRYVYKK